ncbi:MAG: Gfo/Idh/MocA family oxidoreductase [Clostridia bacterium]|nr:Gfo/Idh/MocA family oxidoreductase [Clostridia bacterium]
MNILLVGAGGYATTYIGELLENTDPDVKWVGVVDPYIENSAAKDKIYEAKIPVYADMDAFYREQTADLVLIVTPPFLHRAQSICALSHGSYVLCEKPVAPTVTEAREMLAAEAQYGKFIAVGYQWSYCDEIQSLKRDVLDGTLGAPVSLKTLISWPRNRAYYARGGGWGGRISKDGVTVLDSVASNACAHYLHNMLFVLGDAMETSAAPETVTAQLYRANDIENFDTCAIKMGMKGGAELLFIASHVGKQSYEPEFEYVFENAVVRYCEGDPNGEIVAYFKDGRTKSYGRPRNHTLKKAWDCVRAIKEGTRPVCTVATAIEHTRVIDRLWREFEIKNFDSALIREDTADNRVYVEGLYEKMLAAYEKGTLMSEL